MASYPDSPNDYVKTSYRALRLSIVVLVLTLGASLIIEIVRTDWCLQGSISSYYYTPVHSVFVGALIALGVVMIALKGRDAVEDTLFNIAGVLAPIVALVPTSRPVASAGGRGLCGAADHHLDVPTGALVVNNVPSLAIAAALALVITYVVARRERRITTRPSLPQATQVGLLVCAALLAAGLIWYFGWNANFHRYAHGGTAVAMFVFIWLAVLVNAGWPRALLVRAYRWLQTPLPPALERPTPRHLAYRRWYRGIAVAMPAVALASLLLPGDVRVFWLEVGEIAPFAVFWALQTFEGWDTGVTSTAPPT